MSRGNIGELLYRLYDMKVAFAYDRPVAEIEAYLELPPDEALVKAETRLAQVVEQQKYAPSDYAWWSDEIEKEFYDALVALYKGLIAGRTAFPPMPTNEERAHVFGSRGISLWTARVRGEGREQ